MAIDIKIRKPILQVPDISVEVSEPVPLERLPEKPPEIKEPVSVPVKEPSGWIWESITKWALYLLIFLTPLFFLPWGTSIVGENKQFLATVLIAIALISWLAKTIAIGKLVWQKSPLNLAVLILALVWGLSSFFSSVRTQSLGFLGLEPDGLLNFLKYALAFFLLGASFRKKDVGKAVSVFLFSLAILAVFVGLKFIGFNFLPWDFTKPIDFNPIGTINGLALFLGFGLVMVVGLLMGFSPTKVGSPYGDLDLSRNLSRNWFKIGLIILAIIIAIELLLINFRSVWWAMAGAMLFLVAYELTKQMSRTLEKMRDKSQTGSSVLQSQKFILPMIILAISVILLLVRLPISNLIAFSAEVSPSNSATFEIAKEVMKSAGVKTYLFGSGPTTFIYDYGLHRSQLINQTLFWGVRFSQGANFVLTSLATLGIFGFLSLLFLLFAFVWQMVKKFQISNSQFPVPSSQIPIFPATLFLLISWFFYPMNFTLTLFGFIGLGLLVASSGPVLNTGQISLLVSPQRTLIISLILILLILSSVSGLYLESQKYVGSLYFSAGLKIFNQTGDPDTALTKFIQAINLDAARDQYWRVASQAFLIKTGQILNSPAWQGAAAAALEDLRSQFQVNMSQAISFSQRTTQINPQESLNWSNLGYVYENILSFVTGGEKFLVDSFSRAVSLEPKNPALSVDLGRAHLVIADKIANQINQLAAAQKPDQAQIGLLDKQRSQELELSLIALAKSIELKPDYSPAHFLMVQVYDRQGNLSQAIVKSEDYRNLNPRDAGAAFQLGFLYYKDSQFGKAKTELERAVSLDSNYSNARYFLGLIYDREGNKVAAKEQFEKIAALNPDNSEVKKILENLNNNKPALTEIVPPAPAPAERTETPVEEKGGAKKEGIK